MKVRRANAYCRYCMKHERDHSDEELVEHRRLYAKFEARKKGKR